jgi:hypothetical protein
MTASTKTWSENGQQYGYALRSACGVRLTVARAHITCFIFRVLGFGFRVSGFGIRVSDFKSRVSDFGLGLKPTAARAHITYSTKNMVRVGQDVGCRV